MNQTTIIGFVVGILLVVLGIVVAPYAGDARADVADASDSCPLVVVALDEGYGLSRTEVRPDCAHLLPR